MSRPSNEEMSVWGLPHSALRSRLMGEAYEQLVLKHHKVEVQRDALLVQVAEQEVELVKRRTYHKGAMPFYVNLLKRLHELAYTIRTQGQIVALDELSKTIEAAARLRSELAQLNQPTPDE